MNIMTIKNWPALFSHIITHNITNENEKNYSEEKESSTTQPHPPPTAKECRKRERRIR